MDNIDKAIWEMENQKIGKRIGMFFFAVNLFIITAYNPVPMQAYISMILTIGGIMILKLRRPW